MLDNVKSDIDFNGSSIVLVTINISYCIQPDCTQKVIRASTLEEVKWWYGHG